MTLRVDGVAAASGTRSGRERTGENMSIYFALGTERVDGGWFSASEDWGEGELVTVGGCSGVGEDFSGSLWGTVSGIRDRSEAIDAADAFRIVDAPRVTRFFAAGACSSVDIASLLRFLLLEIRAASVGTLISKFSSSGSWTLAVFAGSGLVGFAVVCFVTVDLVFLALPPLICALGAIDVVVAVVAVNVMLSPSSMERCAKEGISEAIEKLDCVERREALELREALEAREVLEGRPLFDRVGFVV